MPRVPALVGYQALTRHTRTIDLPPPDFSGNGFGRDFVFRDEQLDNWTI